MALVRYIGPHTEGVDLVPQDHPAQFCAWGEVVDLPDEVVHGRASQEATGWDGQPDIIPGIESLLAQVGCWELADGTAPAPQAPETPETAAEPAPEA